MALETPLLQRIRLVIGGRPDTRIFRNNVGIAEYPDGSHVPHGLCPGSADLIGWHCVTVMPEMVGSRLAVFLAIEVKAPGARTAPKRQEAQQAFLDAVRDAGGLAGRARSVEEAEDIITGGPLP